MTHSCFSATTASPLLSRSAMCSGNTCRPADEVSDSSGMPRPMPVQAQRRRPVSNRDLRHPATCRPNVAENAAQRHRRARSDSRVGLLGRVSPNAAPDGSPGRKPFVLRTRIGLARSRHWPRLGQNPSLAALVRLDATDGEQTCSAPRIDALSRRRLDRGQKRAGCAP